MAFFTKSKRSPKVEHKARGVTASTNTQKGFVHKNEAKEQRTIPAKDEVSCGAFLACFGESSMLYKTVHYCNTLSSGYAEFKKHAKDTSAYRSRQGSIPSEVYLGNLSSTTLETTDTTVYNSLCDHVTKDSRESDRYVRSGRSENAIFDSSSRIDHRESGDITLQHSMSSISCPSFAGLSFGSSSKGTHMSEDNQLITEDLMKSIQDLTEGIVMIEPSLESKDSLLSFDGTSSMSGGSNPGLDLLSLDSSEEFGRNGHGILSDICDQSVQSSVQSIEDDFDVEFDESLISTFR
jgi:hypothetical protein